MKRDNKITNKISNLTTIRDWKLKTDILPATLLDCLKLKNFVFFQQFQTDSGLEGKGFLNQLGGGFVDKKKRLFEHVKKSNKKFKEFKKLRRDHWEARTKLLSVFKKALLRKSLAEKRLRNFFSYLGPRLDKKKFLKNFRKAHKISTNKQARVLRRFKSLYHFPEVENKMPPLRKIRKEVYFRFFSKTAAFIDLARRIKQFKKLRRSSKFKKLRKSLGFKRLLRNSALKKLRKSLRIEKKNSSKIREFFNKLQANLGDKKFCKKLRKSREKLKLKEERLVANFEKLRGNPKILKDKLYRRFDKLQTFFKKDLKIDSKKDSKRRYKETKDKITNLIMVSGQKYTGEKILLESIKELQKDSKKQHHELMKLALVHSSPILKLHEISNKRRKKKRKAKVKKVPAFIPYIKKSTALAIRIIVTSTRSKSPETFFTKLKQEILLSAQSKGFSVHKKNELQQQVLLHTRLFRYYRWE